MTVDSLHAEELRKELEAEVDPDRRIWLAEQIDKASGVSSYTTPAAPRQVTDGRTFILDAPTSVPAIWGDGDRVAWALG